MSRPVECRPVESRPSRRARVLAAAVLAAAAALALPLPRAAAQPADAQDSDTMVDTTVDTDSTRTTIRTEDPADNRTTTTERTRYSDGSAVSVDANVDADADDEGPATGDKSSYNLSNPTPKSMMRPMHSDRPDVTDSPYTVDAGHFQIEASFFEYARDEGGEVTAFELLPFIAKVGLTNNIDFQVGIAPWTDVDVGRFDDGSSGFGPILLRAKFNIWGNDGGGAPFELPSSFPDNLRDRWKDSAFALMPYVRIPTGNDEIGTDEFEFGLRAPLEMPLTKDWDLGLMADLGLVHDDTDGDYSLEFLHTASFSRNLGGKLGGFGEYIGVFTGRGGAAYLASLGFGLTYDLRSDLRLDAAVNVGINDNPEDFRFLTGFTYRR